MIRYHMMIEIEKYRKKDKKKEFMKNKIENLEKQFSECLIKHNNKIENCQEIRYKLEEYLMKIKLI